MSEYGFSSAAAAAGGGAFPAMLNPPAMASCTLSNGMTPGLPSGDVISTPTLKLDFTASGTPVSGTSPTLPSGAIMGKVLEAIIVPFRQTSRMDPWSWLLENCLARRFPHQLRRVCLSCPQEFF